MPITLGNLIGYLYYFKRLLLDSVFRFGGGSFCKVLRLYNNVFLVLVLCDAVIDKTKVYTVTLQCLDVSFTLLTTFAVRRYSYYDVIKVKVKGHE